MHNFVIPVKLVLDSDRGTGIQFFQVLSRLWIPAYAGMTDFLRVYQNYRNVFRFISDKFHNISNLVL